MPTSPTRNIIITSLWEWANQNSDWGKLLVNKIVESGDELSEEDRKEVFNLYLFNNQLGGEVAISELSCPNCIIQTNNITLLKICEVKGVNKLAENQELNFSKNITVIYGENGTGKSGYSRILKVFADCYDTRKNILPNIYADVVSNEKRVKIIYKKDETEKEFIWTGENENDDLRGISAFNNDCVELSLDSERGLMVKPSGFYLFTLLSNELEKLKLLSLEKIRLIELPPLEWKYIMTQGTTYTNFVQGLSYSTNIALLDEDFKFNESDRQLLIKKQSELGKLNEDLLKKESADIILQTADLENAKTQISRFALLFNHSNWEELKSSIRSELELQKSESSSLTEIIGKYNIDKFESPEFVAFITSADKYLKKLNKADYPNEKGDICLYCRQKLSDKLTIELLSDYKKILNDDTKEKLRALREKIIELKRKLSVLQVVNLNQASFEFDEEGQIIQPMFLKNYNNQVAKLKKILSPETQTDALNENFSISYINVIDGLNAKKEPLIKRKDAITELLAKLSPEAIRIKKEIGELEDKQLLSEKSNDIKSYVSKLKEIKALESKIDSFNTSSVSRRTTQAREVVITSAFLNKFKEELQNIKPSTIPINFNFRTERGNSILIQNINNQHKFTDILSEGEQKTIALAEFLSEIQLDNNKLPVIFDDPVTSLDHQITWEVARRLVNLSRDRQVVVFTHSIILLNDIKQISETESASGFDYKYYRTEKNLSVTGLLSDEPSTMDDRFGRYKSAINTILGLSQDEKTRRANELAIDGYNKLRAAIEVLVEDTLFNKTIKRHRRSVSLTKMVGINGALIDEHKNTINLIFERCCRYTESHSNTEELSHEPNLEELDADFRTILSISNIFA